MGRKPPSNHPQLTFFAFIRSPTLVPDIVAPALPLAQSSSASGGSGSPITVPFSMPLPVVGVEPCVWPLMRLIAPTVEGPKFVLKLLSLSAKLCARFHMPVTVLPS